MQVDRELCCRWIESMLLVYVLQVDRELSDVSRDHFAALYLHTLVA